MFNLSKQNTYQKYIFKIHSSRLRTNKWNLTLPLSEARKNNEIISLADSTMLRWIDELNGITEAEDKAKKIKAEIRRLRREENSIQNRKAVKKLYADLDEVQFKPDYMCLIIDKNKDYGRACNGFYINGIKYVRLLGTNGGIKNSTIVFVSERLAPELRRRIDNGRDKSKEIVPAKFEAYRALTCSASIPVSMPNGIAVVSDMHTAFKANTVYLDDECEGEPMMEYRYGEEVQLDSADGFGLILPSIAQRWSEELNLDYIASGFNTRCSWEKGMMFTFDYLDFAENVAHTFFIEDAWGNTVDLRNTEMVMTVSQLKLWDSYKNVDEYIDNCIQNHYSFCVTKTCPEVLENERSLNYQFIQGFKLSDDDIEELIKPTMDEIKDVLSGDWRKTLLFLKGKNITEENVARSDDDWIKALMIDHNLLNDPYIQNNIYQLIKNRIEEAKVGVLKVHGNYSILSGDPYALCQHMFGLEITGILKAGELYNKYWCDSDADEVVCFRAPMTSHNNTKKMRVHRSEDASYWYQYMRTCTIINAWDTTMPALNG